MRLTTCIYLRCSDSSTGGQYYRRSACPCSTSLAARAASSRRLAQLRLPSACRTDAPFFSRPQITGCTWSSPTSSTRSCWNLHARARGQRMARASTKLEPFIRTTQAPLSRQQRGVNLRGDGAEALADTCTSKYIIARASWIDCGGGRLVFCLADPNGVSLRALPWLCVPSPA